MKILISLLLLIFTNLSIFSYQYIDYSFDDITENVRSEFQLARDSFEPKIVGEWIVFGFKPKTITHYIGIGFEHENYSKIHKFSKNQFDTYVFATKIPKSLNSINYRILKDGIWTSDNTNTNYFFDNRGFKISKISFNQQEIKYPFITPFVEDNKVTFRYRGETNQNVFITGDFISWDPFSYKMIEEKPGEYIFKLHLNDGEYHYYFLVNGDKTIDRYNFDVDISKINGPVSYFKVEG